MSRKEQQHILNYQRKNDEIRLVVKEKTTKYVELLWEEQQNNNNIPRIIKEGRAKNFELRRKNKEIHQTAKEKTSNIPTCQGKNTKTFLITKDRITKNIKLRRDKEKQTSDCERENNKIRQAEVTTHV